LLDLKTVSKRRLKPVNIKKLRGTVGMTQAEFAATFGISLGTLPQFVQPITLPL